MVRKNILSCSPVPSIILKVSILLNKKKNHIIDGAFCPELGDKECKFLRSFF